MAAADAAHSCAAAVGAAAASVPVDNILRLLQRASREVRDLDVGLSVDRVALDDLPPLRFAAEYVQRNKPVIITGAIDGWPATWLWAERYLTCHPAGAQMVTVDVTPNGKGDALTAVGTLGGPRRWFVTPHERRMSLREFFRLMRRTRAAEKSRAAGAAEGPPREVPYMQHQNSNLSEELGLLLKDIGPGLPWAESVFGGPPEATNLWIGDQRSATSFHKDHYENLYAVVRGTKVFTLLPPCDAYRMYLVTCPAASYVPYCDVPSGAVYGEVSPRPGGPPPARGGASATAASNSDATAGDAPAAAASASAAAAATVAAYAPQPAAGGAVGSDSGPRRACPSGGAGGGGDPGRLVAVLQDPGFEVLWSAVDTTMSDPNARAAQPLFYGRSGSAGGSEAAAADGDDGDGDHRSTGSSCGDGDPWVAAGGAPLIAEVGPGELLYLPALWYHQVEQREGRGRQAVKGAGVVGAGVGGGSGTRAEMRGQRQHQEEEEPEREGPEEGEDEYVIAVNFWYDMKYDSRYSSFKLVEGLATALGLADPPPIREAGAEKA